MNEGERVIRALFPASSESMQEKLVKVYYDELINFKIEEIKHKLLNPNEKE